MFPLKDEYLVRDVPVALNWQRVAARMGSGAGRTEGLKERIISLESNISLQPSFSLRNYAVYSVDRKGIGIANGKWIMGSRFRDLMDGISHISVYSLTVGHLPILDSDLDSLILEHISSEAAEQTAKRMILMLSDIAKGWRSTKRRSPGYPGFPIEQQQMILDLSGGERLGIEVTDSFYLLPMKSTTGIAGWRYEG